MLTCWSCLNPQKVASAIRFALLGHDVGGDETRPQCVQDTVDDYWTYEELERRIADNGWPYTRQEFVDFYGQESWKFHWDVARIFIPPPAPEPEASSEISCSSIGWRSYHEPIGWRLYHEGYCRECGTWSAACTQGAGGFIDEVYCEDCWNSYMERLPRVAAPEETPESSCFDMPSRRQHFDFIEVGTSDWCTLSQFCAGDPRGSWLGHEIRTSLEDLRQARGLAVEAVGEHLECLPHLPRVTQVEAGMGEFSGDDVLFYVSAKNIEDHMGEYYASLHKEVDVMWYAKSMSSIGKPHPQLEHMLSSIDRLDFLEQRRVQVFSWGDLCRRYGVTSVDVVQLDCEGMDCSVIRGLITHCKNYPDAFPRVIVFEANCLTDPGEVQETVEALLASGYRVRSQTWENITVER